MHYVQAYFQNSIRALFLMLFCMSIVSCGSSSNTTPSITDIRIIQSENFNRSQPLQVELDCNLCDGYQLSYLWYLDNQITPVSTINSYTPGDNYGLERITVTVAVQDGEEVLAEKTVSLELDRVVHIVGNSGAFAALRSDGSVHTWGSIEYGGDSFSVQPRLKNIKEIISAPSAFIAITEDNEKVVWGSENNGGEVPEGYDLSNAVSIVGIKPFTNFQNAWGSFAALMDNGTVLTWGNSRAGNIEEELNNIKQLFALTGGFAAVDSHNNVIAWMEGESAKEIIVGEAIESISNVGSTIAILAESGKVIVDGTLLPEEENIENITKLISNDRSFSAIKEDGSVIAWGHPSWGGDVETASGDLVNIIDIQALEYSYVALTDDGNIIVWGEDQLLQDYEDASALLFNIKEIQVTGDTVIARRSDGAVISFGGEPIYPYSGPADAQLIEGIHKVFAAENAVSAITKNGEIISWGHETYGGFSASLAHLTSNIKDIQVAGASIAVLDENNNVNSWGINFFKGDTQFRDVTVTDVSELLSNGSSFFALKADGTGISWGAENEQRYNEGIDDKLFGIKEVIPGRESFSVIRSDGLAFSFGDSEHGGDSSGVSVELVNIDKIISSYKHYAALRADGTAILWGENSSDTLADVKSLYSGPDGIVAVRDDDSLTSDWKYGSTVVGDVSSVFSNDWAWAAIKKDKTVYTWGRSVYGGDSSAVQEQLQGVESITASSEAFAAVLETGAVVTWGNNNLGGESDYVQNELYDISSIEAGYGEFIALRGDGKAIKWGRGEYEVIDDISAAISSVRSNASAILIRNDGTAIINDKEIQDFNKAVFTSSEGYIALTNNGELVANGDTLSLSPFDLAVKKFSLIEM